METFILFHVGKTKHKVTWSTDIVPLTSLKQQFYDCAYYAKQNRNTYKQGKGLSHNQIKNSESIECSLTEAIFVFQRRSSSFGYKFWNSEVHGLLQSDPVFLRAHTILGKPRLIRVIMYPLNI